MLNHLICLLKGHDYELKSHDSFPPEPFKFNLSQVMGVPFSFQAKLLGYTKTVQICRRCGKVHVTMSLGQ